MNLHDIKQMFAEYICDDYDYNTSDFVDAMLKDHDDYSYDYHSDGVTSFAHNNQYYELNVKDSILQIQDTFESYFDEMYSYDFLNDTIGADLEYYSGGNIANFTDYLQTLPNYDQNKIFDMLYNIFLENRDEIYNMAFELIKPLLYKDFADINHEYLNKFTYYIDSNYDYED